jgi:hypothetical protein
MDLQPHQQRVVFEKNDLDGKIERLTAFHNDTPQDARVSLEERERMGRQLDAMRTYSEVLGDRIAAFSA